MIGVDDRLELLPVAVRILGPDLLVAPPGPWRDVTRLTGSGPHLWRLFGDGLRLEEVARQAAEAAGVAVDDVRADVLAFADELVASGLARPA